MRNISESSASLVVGKVVKAHGIKGQIKVLPFSGIPADLLPCKKVLLGFDSDRISYRVESCRAQGKFTVFKLEGVSDRDGSEALIGHELWVEKGFLPELSADEFYWHDMEGLEVSTVAGQTLGRVTSLMATGANDVLVVSGQGHEYLIPAIEEIIVSIDHEAGTIVISPPPGLLEMNDAG